MSEQYAETESRKWWVLTPYGWQVWPKKPAGPSLPYCTCEACR